MNKKEKWYVKSYSAPDDSSAHYFDSEEEANKWIEDNPFDGFAKFRGAYHTKPAKIEE